MKIINYEGLLVDDRVNILYAINEGRDIIIMLQTKDKGVGNKEMKGLVIA